MNEFVLLFRRDYKTVEIQPSQDVMHTHLKHWQDWFRSLAAQDLLARPVQRLDPEGKVIGPNNTETVGPYSEMNESMGGLIIIKAADYEAAINVAKGCPILEVGGNVEIRMGS